MAWSFPVPWDLPGFIQRLKNNLDNGYHFGDVLRANWGFSDDEVSAEDAASDTGSFFNDITGVTSSNAFSAGQAKDNRDWQTAERIAAQDYNSAEAQKARDFELMMDSTRYSRAMADLQKAGINPMALYAGSGMSAGSAGSSSAASVSAGSGSSAGASGNSASAVSGIIRALAGLIKVVK